MRLCHDVFRLLWGGVTPDEETRGEKVCKRSGSTAPPRLKCNVVRLFSIPLFVVTIIMFTAIASLLLSISGCTKNSEYFPIEDHIERYVRVGTEPMNLPGMAPFTMPYVLDVSLDDPDVLKNTPVTNASIDFGDGYGFVDVTEKLLKSDWQYDLSDVYTYSEPGTYTLQARATYWDGEVITYVFPVPITVLPPSDGDGA